MKITMMAATTTIDNVDDDSDRGDDNDGVIDANENEYHADDHGSLGRGGNSFVLCVQIATGGLSPNPVLNLHPSQTSARTLNPPLGWH